jgi:hypothetical protein
MTKHDYCAALEVLGLSWIAAAKVLGIAARTSRDYALGERPVPELIALGLRLLLEKQRRKRRARERRQTQWRGVVSAGTPHGPAGRNGGAVLSPGHESSANTSQRGNWAVAKMLIMTLFAALICAVVALLLSGRKPPAHRRQKAFTTSGSKSEASRLRHSDAQQCKEQSSSRCHVHPEITRTNNGAP